MRGKEKQIQTRPKRKRITPAYAGKSTCLILFDALHEDHPRVCGEKQRSRRRLKAEIGSPPRMRGKEGGDLFAAVVDGITPAYAGKSAVVAATQGAARDHPRVCGEKGDKVKHSLLPCFGITPAYAGKRGCSCLG